MPKREAGMTTNYSRRLVGPTTYRDTIESNGHHTHHDRQD